MSDIDTIETYRRLADVLRSAQRVAIDGENAPEKRKRLRTFSAQEVALLLGVSSRELSAYTRSSHDRAGGPRSRLSFEEVLQLRRSLF